METKDVQCRSWDELEVHLCCVYARQDQIMERLRHIEKQLDTLGSPWWKRILFWLDGWPAWWVVAQRPAWRPWHKWWIS